MTNRITLVVKKVCGQDLCVASRDGEKLHDAIVGAIRKKKRTVVSFKGVTLLSSAFLNRAIGSLYGEFEEETIRTLIKIKDIDQDDRMLIKTVAVNAKRYFKDPKGYERAIKKAMEK